MVEEETFICIEARYLLHIAVTEREVEDVEILLHTFEVGISRYYNHIALNEPSEPPDPQSLNSRP